MRCQRCHSKYNLQKNSVNSNGNFQYICRNCNTERLRKYRSTKDGKATTYKAVYKSVKKYPEKQRARTRVNYALQHGHIIKPKRCVDCKKKVPLFGHHEDYSKPLQVIWVCRSCHVLRDKNLL